MTPTTIGDDRWHDLREQCERVEPGAELVTPVSERRFAVAATYEDRIVVRFRDSGEERSLEREQFDVLADRLTRGAIDVSTLAPGVEPYATVLTLSPAYTVDDDALVPASDPDAKTDSDEGAAGASPYLVSPEAARTRPERVHDDALLLADAIERIGDDGIEYGSLETDALTDLYVLLSDVQRGADRLRGATRDALLERLGPDQTLHGRFGAVRRTTRRSRRVKDEGVVLDALDEHGIPHEWVLGIDQDKLDVVLTTTDLAEDEVYDVDEQVYAQKTGVDEGEKFSRLQGLADRIDELDGEEGDELRDELEDLEGRLEEALSAG